MSRKITLNKKHVTKSDTRTLDTTTLVRTEPEPIPTTITPIPHPPDVKSTNEKGSIPRDVLHADCTERVLPWIEKYRPQNLAELISHPQKVIVLKKLAETREIPHLLLYGSPGSGKTSTILALVKELYGKNYKNYVLELNASDHRGIDVVRYDIPKFAAAKTSELKFVVLDEADAMTVAAQSALRRVMELFSKNCRFVLICNQKNKIISGIQSRCCHMRYGVLDPASIREKLHQITNLENIKVEPQVIQYLIKNTRDFRQILNILQCLKCLKTNIQVTDVVEYCGIPSESQVAEILEHLKKDDFLTNYNHLLKLYRENTINIEEMIRAISNIIIGDITIALPQKSRIIERLAEIEYRCITGLDTELQLASLTLLFH